MAAFGLPTFQLCYSDTLITRLGLYLNWNPKPLAVHKRQAFLTRPINKSTDLLHSLLNNTYLTLVFTLLWPFIVL